MEQRENNSNPDSAQNDPLDYTNDPSGVHVQNRPVGADQMNESYSKPESSTHEPGDSSKYANTSGNENNGGDA